MNERITFIAGIIFLLVIFLMVGLTGRGILWIVFVLFILSVLTFRAIVGEISKRQEIYFLLFLSILFISALFVIDFEF